MCRNKHNFNSRSFCVNLLRVVPNKAFALTVSILFLLFCKGMLFSLFLLLPTSLIFPRLQEIWVFILLCHLLARLDSSHFATVSLSFLIGAVGLKSLRCQPWWDTERTNREDGCEQKYTASPASNRPAPHFYHRFPATGVVNAQPSLPVLAHPGELDAACVQWEQLAFLSLNL